MLRDITIGQYYQAQSLIHKLDPRVKIGGTLIYVITLFFYKNFVGYGLAILFLALVIRLSKVPFKFMVRGMKSILFLLMLTVLFNLFLTPGTPVISFWKLQITQEGTAMAVSMALRLTLLVIGSSLMTLTTTPNNLTDGMEKMMGFLKVFKVPVHEVAMMMSIALRFIPILLEETDKIMKAQMARGADFESGHLIARAKAMVPLLVPARQRSRHGNGSKVLPRRRGQDEDETSEVQGPRLRGVSAPFIFHDREHLGWAIKAPHAHGRHYIVSSKTGGTGYEIFRIRKGCRCRLLSGRARAGRALCLSE